MKRSSMPLSAEITVLGAGSYGTALAICFARHGHRTILWGHTPSHVDALRSQRENQKYLPNIPFPESLIPEPDLDVALAASRHVLVVVPSHAFAETLNRAKPYLRSDATITWATKGLEYETGRLLQESAKDILGDSYALGVLSGPTFAKEMAVSMPTAITLSSESDELIDAISELLHCEKSLRVYTNHDLIGVQIGGAVKNVIAIGAGMSDGIGFGANARTALITRGLAEMTRLGLALGAIPETFMGMSGLGDLVLTCTDNQSRNRRFGLALGESTNAEEAKLAIGQVVEGFRNTKEVHLLAKKVGVEMPITEQIYQVLYEGKPAKLAAAALLGREKKSEV